MGGVPPPPLVTLVSSHGGLTFSFSATVVTLALEYQDPLEPR